MPLVSSKVDFECFRLISEALCNEDSLPSQLYDGFLLSVVDQLFIMIKNVAEITQWATTHAANFMQQCEG